MRISDWSSDVCSADLSGVGLTLGKAEALAGPDASIGIVGLGAGTLACYRKPGKDWTIVEIDPVRVDIARDPEKFNFLSNCAPGYPHVIGDARLRIAEPVPERGVKGKRESVRVAPGGSQISK